MFQKAGNSCFASHWKAHGYPLIRKLEVTRDLKYVQTVSVNSNTEHDDLLYLLDTWVKGVNFCYFHIVSV